MSTTPDPYPDPLTKDSARIPPRAGDPGTAPLTGEPGRPATTTARPAKSGRVSVSSKTGYAWSGLVAGAIILIVLLIFILQNLDQVPINLFFWEFTLPLGVTVLLSVIIGALLMALVGGMRILQLRRIAKHPR